MLLSETHLTNKYNFNISGFKFYATNHPDGRAHGGSGILIRNRIKHFPLESYSTVYLQATSIRMQGLQGNLTLTAVYCPPRFVVTEEIFKKFFNYFGDRFLAAGDYNAKHPYWGSRLANSKGRQLYKAIINSNNTLDFASPGKPTYWPTDPRKVPDLIDFAITRRLPRNIITTDAHTDLSSDHSPVSFVVLDHPQIIDPPYRVTSSNTNWLKFKKYISAHIVTSPQINSVEDIEHSVEMFNSILISAARHSTSSSTSFTRQETRNITNSGIERLVMEKRRCRREWQEYRSPASKVRFKNAEKTLRKALKLEKEYNNRRLVQNLSPTGANLSLWKAQKLRPPSETETPIRDEQGAWARTDAEIANVFADHLRMVFQPNPPTNGVELPVTQTDSRNFGRESPSPLEYSNNAIQISPHELKAMIENEMNPKKTPGYDQISPKMIVDIPNCAVRFLSVLFNAILQVGHFPSQWKKSIIIMIPKPGKNKAKAASYRPISLLPSLSKLFEKLLKRKLMPHLQQNNIVPPHQFGFREKHGTIEQVNRISSEIRNAFERREYCSAIFLDVAQAFDRVWHEGLVYKIQRNLPQSSHKILESYLTNRVFMVRYKNYLTDEVDIKAGVPQGSVLGPLLYVIYTADLPTNPQIFTSTFADDTAILCRSKCPIRASGVLNNHLKHIVKWLAEWRIKVNEQKCNHVTFTLNRSDSSSVYLNSTLIPHAKEVTYLGVRMDRRLTWKRHIEAKSGQMKLKTKEFHWLINSRSGLSLDDRVLFYNTIIKPIWTYASQLWGNTSASNIAIIQRRQSKILRMITKAPWYITNENIHRDLNIPLVAAEIAAIQDNYYQRLRHHPNPLARSLLNTVNSSRLRRIDLPTL